MAKTAIDIIKSRLARQEILDKYGGEIPSSLWVANVSADEEVIQIEAKARKEAKNKAQRAIEETKADPIQAKLLRELYGKSGYCARNENSFSIMPANIVRRVVNFYSEPGELVLDPCAGHNSRMQVTFDCGRSYIGYDVCSKFMEFNRQTAETIQKRAGRSFFSGGKSCSITLREQSSEKMKEADSTIDLIFTSPPYWDLEHYDDDPRQLGIGKTYNQFLEGMERVTLECLRVLKPGKFCVFNVNDFRKDGRFYPYHADTMNLFQKVGFNIFDVIIMAWPSLPFRSIFATQVEATKQTGKQHEFILVFKKP